VTVTATLTGTRRALLRDGLALTIGVGASTVAGAVAWLASARLLPPDEVGAASAFISGCLLVAGISELGLGQALLRWLPAAGNQRARLLRRSYACVVLTAVVVSSVFLLMPTGSTVRQALHSWWVPPLFVVFSVTWTLFQFQDSVLAGLRRARWVAWENSAFGLSRVALLVPLGLMAGTTGILLSWVVPTVIGVLIVTILVRKTLGPSVPGVLPSRKETARLLGASYAATCALAMFYNLVPLIVTARFGTAQGAVFFMTWTAVSAADLGATAFGNSIVVRIAGEPGQSRHLVRFGIARLLGVFGPLLAIGVVFAPLALSLFGPEYSAQGASLLRLLLLGCLPRLLVVLAIAVNLARGDGRRVAFLQSTGALAMVLVVSLAPVTGLMSAGWAYLAVQLVLAVPAVFCLKREGA
jgi:O-antigen/teichoic acid export membrane protein